MLEEHQLGDGRLGEMSDTPHKAGSLDYIRNLERCLDCIVSYFDYFCKIPSINYPCVPFAHYSYLSHFIISLYRLTTIDDPAWDVAEVRKRIDVLEIADHFINKMLEVHQTANYVLNDGSMAIFTRFGKIMGFIRDEWAAELAEKARGPVDPPGQEQDGPPAVYTDPTLMDEDLFQDVLMPWDDVLFR
jgi:hypothetical protein